MCGSGHVFEKIDKKAALYLVKSLDKKRWWRKTAVILGACAPRTCGTLSKTLEKRRTLTKRSKAQISAWGHRDKGLEGVIGGRFGKRLVALVCGGGVVAFFGGLLKFP